MRQVSPRAWDTQPNLAAYAGKPFVTEYVHDEVNQITRVDLPASADELSAGTRQYVHNAYDKNGRLEWTSQPVTARAAVDVADAQKTKMTFFDPGWVRTTQEGTNAKVHFEYSPEGWQTARTPEKDGAQDAERRLTWTHTATGQIKEATDQKGQKATYEYDLHDKLKKARHGQGLTDPNLKAMEVEVTYTALDQLKKARQKKEDAATWTATKFAYDLGGNVTERTDDVSENADLAPFHSSAVQVLRRGVASAAPCSFLLLGAALAHDERRVRPVLQLHGEQAEAGEPPQQFHHACVLALRQPLPRRSSAWSHGRSVPATSRLSTVGPSRMNGSLWSRR